MSRDAVLYRLVVRLHTALTCYLNLQERSWRQQTPVKRGTFFYSLQYPEQWKDKLKLLPKSSLHLLSQFTLPSFHIYICFRGIICVNLTEVSNVNHRVTTNISYLLRAARTAFTAHTGSLVSPTRKVTSQSSGMLARNFMSSARPLLFSNVLKSDSSLCCGASAMMALLAASGIETSQW